VRYSLTPNVIYAHESNLRANNKTMLAANTIFATLKFICFIDTFCNYSIENSEPSRKSAFLKE
jgi:hypothetical protein